MVSTGKSIRKTLFMVRLMLRKHDGCLSSGWQNTVLSFFICKNSLRYQSPGTGSCISADYPRGSSFCLGRICRNNLIEVHLWYSAGHSCVRKEWALSHFRYGAAELAVDTDCPDEPIGGMLGELWAIRSK